MKNYQLFILLLLCLLLGQISPLLAQESVVFELENFDQKILNYTPDQRAGVDEDKFKSGLRLLQETQRTIKEDEDGFNYADYWNISTAFIRLGEPKAHIEVAFQKAVNKNLRSTCELIDAFGLSRMQTLRDAIPEVFEACLAQCESLPKQEEEVFDPLTYAQENKYDVALVKLMHQISVDDQLYRGEDPVDWSKQTPLDQRNMDLIDSLYQVHGQYIGSDMIGKKMESTMWAVIQHSTVEKMQEYLPIVHQAVLAEGLHPTPLKMLLDRIYSINEGQQIFGSQGGVPIGDEAFCAAVRKEYGL
ncbi:MAG: DUF6624 domain-containing protein [Bacteroidota bacterium]